MTKDQSKKWMVAAVFGAAYLLAVFWVFTRSSPLLEDRPITLRIAHWQIELGPPDGIDAIIARYEELNPDVRVRQILIPSVVYRQWLRSNFTGNTAPDIVEYGAWLDGLSDFPARYFEPLTAELLEPNPYNEGTPLAGRPWLDTFVDGLIEQRLNSPEPGQFYAVTLARASMRLFCNRELLREVTGTDDIPRTLAELRTVFGQVRAHAERAGRPLHALAGSRDNSMWLMEYYMAGLTTRLTRSLDLEGVHGVYGRQNLRAYLEGEWNFQQPELRAALTVMQDFSRQMKPGFLQLSRDEAAREFLGGEALFIFAGTWDATTLRRLAGFTVEALRLPQPTLDDPVIGPYVLGRFSDGDNTTSFGFYLNKQSPHREAAVDFMRFMTSHEGSRLFTERSGWPPATAEVPVPADLESYLSPGDGYAYGGSYIMSGGHMRLMYARNLHHLAGPQGSVERMAVVLEAEGPEAARADLRLEQRAARTVVLPQDARVAALGAALDGTSASADPARRLRRERLEAAQNQSEARALMIGSWLRNTASEDDRP